MTIRAAHSQPVLRGQERPYQDASLVELAEGIVYSSDAQALRELHDQRTPFRFHVDRPMTFAGLVAALSETSWAARLCCSDRIVLDRARDLTVDEFARMPQNRRDATNRRHNGPDCRNYFRKFLKSMRAWEADNPAARALQRETRAARLLQRLVVSQFRLSCLEARRSCNPVRSRYAWHVNGGTLYVWMPAAISGRKRRSWLEANVDCPDPSRPGEHHRVQAIVDEHLGVGRHVPLDANASTIPARQLADLASTSIIAEERGAYELARVVAEEKAQRINHQRPAIQALGEANLKCLVISVFEALSNERYAEGRLAHAFGLSKATFSRFAGSRWRVPERIPDLWANTAHTVARHATFIEAAEEAGVWTQVQNVLRVGPNAGAWRIDDA